MLVVTDHPLNEVVTRVDSDPCTGVPVLLTATETGVLHVTRLPDGSVSFTVALRARFAADFWPDGGSDATGAYTVHGGGSGYLNLDGTAFDHGELTRTVDGSGTRSDGSTFRFHLNSHTVFGPGGLPRTELAHAHCR